MSFSTLDVKRRTKKGNFLKQVDYLIDWAPIETTIKQYYAPKSDVIGRPAYSGLLLFKMLLIGIWNGGLSDEAVEDKANSDLHVIHFLGQDLEDDVPDHSVLSRFRTALTEAKAWDALLDSINTQLLTRNVMVKGGYHVDASVTPSQRKPKSKPTYEVRTDRSEHDDETDAQVAMKVLVVTQPGVDTEARWTKKAGKYQFGYKQHTLVNQDGLVQGIITTPANRHDSKPFVELLEKGKLPEGGRVCADKAYASDAHRKFLKTKRLKDGIQNKAVKNKALTERQKQRNSLISQVRFVIERTFGSESLWHGGKGLRYVGEDKAHSWHVLQAIGYNLKRLPVLWIKNNVQPPQLLCV